MDQFRDFAKRYNITVDAIPIQTRHDRVNCGWDLTAIHWQITLMIGDSRLWSGEYSKGFGHAEQWIKKNLQKAKAVRDGFSSLFDYWDSPPPMGRRYNDDSFPVQALRALYGKHHKPHPSEILHSLQMDTIGCDQPFEDWASDMAYDVDSRKAYAIWEACNLVRRQLFQGFSTVQWAEFTELEE